VPVLSQRAGENGTRSRLRQRLRKPVLSGVIYSAVLASVGCGMQSQQAPRERLIAEMEAATQSSVAQLPITLTMIMEAHFVAGGAYVVVLEREQPS